MATKRRSKSKVSKAEPISLLAETPGTGFPIGKLMLGLAALALLLFLAMRHGSPSSGGAASSEATHPVWGPEVKLEAAGKFEIPEELMALKVDAQGTVYALTKDKIISYKNGVKSAGLDLKVSANSWNQGMAWNLALDANSLYVAVRDSIIIKAPKNLSKIEKRIELAGSSDLFGIDVAPSGMIYAADIQLHQVFKLNDKGKAKGEVGASTPEGGSLNCVVDVALDPDGGLYTHDHLALLIDHFSASGALLSSQPVPWSNHNWERLCLLKGKLYINGYNDHRLFIQGPDGKNIAQCLKLADGSKLDLPKNITAGQDGFLYVKNGTTLYKIKPYTEAPAPAAASAAKAPASK